ncbi:MAG: chalcone isomerase family protein [Pseudomonadota bacterium]
MKYLARALLLSTTLASMPTWAAIEVNGVKFADTYQVGSQPLMLNGAGVRVKIIVDVYAAGLYLPKKDTTDTGAVSQSGAKSVQIVLLRELTGEEFATAMIKGFKANNAETDVARHQAKLEEIRTLMVGLGTVKKGTSIHIDFTPGAGTRVLMDGKPKGPEIVGDDFNQALLRIWLGQKPVDSDLKHAMLGAK